MTCRKVPYLSKRSAADALHELRGTGVRRFYLCRCGAWHLTSKPAR